MLYLNFSYLGTEQDNFNENEIQPISKYTNSSKKQVP